MSLLGRHLGHRSGASRGAAVALYRSLTRRRRAETVGYVCARGSRRRRASYVTSRSGVASRGRVGPSQRAHVPKRGSGGTLSQHLNYLKIRQEHQEPSRGCFPRLAEQLNSSLTGAVTTPDYRGEEEVDAFTASDADSLTRWRGAENVAGTCGINSRRAAGSWANPEPATRQATYQRGRTVSERRKVAAQQMAA